MVTVMVFTVQCTTTWVSWHQKGKPFWILLKQEIMGGSGLSWTICKSFAPHPTHIPTPVPHHQYLFNNGCICIGAKKFSLWQTDADTHMPMITTHVSGYAYAKCNYACRINIAWNCFAEKHGVTVARLDRCWLWATSRIRDT